MSPLLCTCPPGDKRYLMCSKCSFFHDAFHAVIDMFSAGVMQVLACSLSSVLYRLFLRVLW